MTIQTNKKVLHVVLNTGPTNMGFNEFYLSAPDTSSCLSYMPSREAEYSAEGSVLSIFFKARYFSKKYNVIHFHSHVLAFVYCLGLLLSYPGGLKRCMYTVHTSSDNLSIRNYVCFFISLLLCKKTICCSRSSYLSFSFLIRRLFSYKLSYITNGVHIDTNNISFVPHEPIRIISVGRLIKIKAPNITLSALKSFRSSFSCVFLGKGVLEAELKDVVANDNRFEFLGLVERSEVSEFLLRSDIYISSSLVEGMPIGALEAAAGGCYLLLSNIPPHNEIKNDIPYCQLFDSEDELKEILNGLLEKDSNFFNNVFINNRRAVSESFSINEMLKSYAMVYKDLMI